MSYAILVRRFDVRRWLSQAPALALILSIAAYGPLLQRAQLQQQPLPAATLQQLKAGFNPINAVGKAVGATGRFLGRNIRAIGGAVSIGAGAISALYGTAAASIGLTFLEIGGGGLLMAGALVAVGGVGLVGLGGWLIYRNFADRK